MKTFVILVLIGLLYLCAVTADASCAFGFCSGYPCTTSAECLGDCYCIGAGSGTGQCMSIDRTED